jgi:1-pyrroline-5-carboxylate dehydrogenase
VSHSRAAAFAETFTAARSTLVSWSGPNVGHADGTRGDLAMLAPPFVVTEEEIEEMVALFTGRYSPPPPGSGGAIPRAPDHLHLRHRRPRGFPSPVRRGARRRARAAGGRYLCRIGGVAVETGGDVLEDRSPIDTGVPAGPLCHRRACRGGPRAVVAARGAQRDWARRPWRERVDLLKRAAALIRERKYDLAALMRLEVGKRRLEAMGDTEESADLIDYDCGQVEEADGFVRPMGRITPVERNTDVLRPYGVFTCIAPFNFPLALSAGMSSAALVAGNAVVYKPSEDTPLTGLRLAEIYEDAGLPPGVFNFLVGRREEIGDALWQHPGVDGVVFTGSKAVGLRIFHGLSERWVKPCLMELAAERRAGRGQCRSGCRGRRVMRSAFSLQNQKCSATSRVYVHRASPTSS